MCIIAVKPANIVLSKEQNEIMWEANPHGAGFMYHDGTQVVLKKGFMKFKQFWAAYSAIQEKHLTVSHFRIKTHGEVQESLTHPFWVQEGNLAMVHNGIIHSVTKDTNNEKSDTAVFAERLGNSFIDASVAIKVPMIQDMISSYIGNSKLVFLDKTGETTIINANKGEKDFGCWFSNSSYKEIKKPEPTHYTTGAYESESSWWQNNNYIPYIDYYDAAKEKTRTKFPIGSEVELILPRYSIWTQTSKQNGHRQEKLVLYKGDLLKIEAHEEYVSHLKLECTPAKAPECLVILEHYMVNPVHEIIELQPL